MARHSRRSRAEDVKLDMTPMIDVVFQLLIFFLVTMKFEDILSHLDVNRPSPDASAKKQEKVADMLTIGIFVDGVTLNGRPMPMAKLDRMIEKVAALGTDQTVLIQCAPDSPHEKLIEVLDYCAQAKLTNLSVMSL